VSIEFPPEASREPVSCRCVLDGELIFLPDRIPRRGAFARWGLGTGNTKVELVFPGGTYGVRKRLMTADLIPVTEALPALLTADPESPMRRSTRVWAAAAAAGAGMVARGRLVPSVAPDGSDIWRAGPLDPADLSWVHELAAVFPPGAHALAIPGSRPMRLRSPQALVRELWDAIADTLTRSPAAARITASPAFAADETTDVGDLAAWLADTTDGLSAGARLGLRIEPAPPEPALEPPEPAIEPPERDDAAFRLVLQLRSTADPSLIVDAAELWSQPETVLTRFGNRAEEDLLLGLRRGAAIWPPLAGVLAQATPSAVDLRDDDLTGLLAQAEDLNGAGIEMLWPSSMTGDGLKLRAAFTPAPGQVTEAGLNLGSLLEFRWQLAVGGRALDPDEIAALAEAKRPLIRLRGRWVLLDPALLDKLRRPPRTRMRAAEALGAVLAGEAEVDGEIVPVHAEGALADLAGSANSRSPRNRSRPRRSWRRRCVRTSSAASPGWPPCARRVLAVVSRTTWAWARRSSSSRCTSTVATRNAVPRSWCARHRCSAPGNGRCAGSRPESRSAATTAAGGTSKTWRPVRSCWSPTACCCVTRRCWLRSAGGWSSRTRRST
jgi:hypothetical protein